MIKVLNVKSNHEQQNCLFLMDSPSSKINIDIITVNLYYHNNVTKIVTPNI